MPLRLLQDVSVTIHREAAPPEVVVLRASLRWQAVQPHSDKTFPNRLLMDSRVKGCHHFPDTHSPGMEIAEPPLWKIFCMDLGKLVLASPGHLVPPEFDSQILQS